jgi:hypothetical protein
MMGITCIECLENNDSFINDINLDYSYNFTAENNMNDENYSDCVMRQKCLIQVKFLRNHSYLQIIIYIQSLSNMIQIYPKNYYMKTQM